MNSQNQFFTEYAVLFTATSIAALIILGILVVIYPLIAYIGLIIIQLMLLYTLFRCIDEMIDYKLN